MPTYSYECQNCRHTFDIFQKITDEPQKICPDCKNPSLKRLISAGIGLIFKGSGFYITDYRSKEYREKSQQEKEPSPSSTSKESKASK